MSRLAIKHKKTGLFYNNLNWVELESARLFKRKSDLNIFLNRNCVMQYDHNDIGVEGLSYFEQSDTKIKVTKEKEFEIVKVKLVEVEDED